MQLYLRKVEAYRHDIASLSILATFKNFSNHLEVETRQEDLAILIRRPHPLDTDHETGFTTLGAYKGRGAICSKDSLSELTPKEVKTFAHEVKFEQ